MKASVIIFPGTNREQDVADVLESVSGRAPQLVWHSETEVPPSDLIVLPGGFSYGDYLRCGAMAARSPIMRDVIAKAKQGTPVLGICNGFQILCESGLLPGVLMRNASLRFVCKDVWLRVEQPDTVFTRRFKKGEVMRAIAAHAEGNYFTDPETLARLEGEGRVVFRYADKNGNVTPEANPNGALNNIAGICDERRRVLGLMPHPENTADPMLGATEGRKLFESLVESLVA
ncbi:MAG: phosphoribosylformylglycinamidine synthase subunit PurQ [Proteobacteria bacterium]|jgi:phosphoribosylformylglycinamidine synthase I|nr:MAG: phosphoribosylformylglycinamidine synthase subunit PurQ [Pseudomonadota bacterium]